MSAEEVAKAFVKHYYACFDGNREQMVGLYRDHSLLTFEGDGPKRGSAQIMEKLRQLPPVRRDHRVPRRMHLSKPRFSQNHRRPWSCGARRSRTTRRRSRCRRRSRRTRSSSSARARS
mmetsp:Transcript_21468/g.85389  ORF Transcript_21468/g.85389 Transcript_21468/m.85389 type:complete len:118 (+) Transcript_21468:107-460(+)